jgi:hypothetical protein
MPGEPKPPSYEIVRLPEDGAWRQALLNIAASLAAAAAGLALAGALQTVRIVGSVSPLWVCRHRGCGDLRRAPRPRPPAAWLAVRRGIQA